MTIVKIIEPQAIKSITHQPYKLFNIAPETQFVFCIVSPCQILEIYLDQILPDDDFPFEVGAEIVFGHRLDGVVWKHPTIEQYVMRQDAACLLSRVFFSVEEVPVEET